MQGIHAPSRDLGTCISLARDACADARMSCHRRIHASRCYLRHAVLAVGPLWFFEMFICMSYDWGITITVHMHRGLIMFKVQLVICSNWTRSILERSYAFVIGDAVQVQRR